MATTSKEPGTFHLAPSKWWMDYGQDLDRAARRLLAASTADERDVARAELEGVLNRRPAGS